MFKVLCFATLIALAFAQQEHGHGPASSSQQIQRYEGPAHVVYGNNGYRNGYGYGYSNGYGYGHGYGNNNGIGYGNTYGNGYGNNYGNGYGNNYGNGYGNNYGNRYGNNYGNGNGHNYGNGYGNNYGNRYGNNYGNGYGNNYGNGYGNNYGNGYGNNYGNRYGNNYGNGNGNNYGHGYGYVDYYAYPRYNFEYKVEDRHTGDIKAQQESRDGDVVKGYYALHQPNGSERSVHYYSDDHTGFQADVKYATHHFYPKYNH